MIMYLMFLRRVKKVKIIEFEQVYLEIPEELLKEPEEKAQVSLSLDELKRRLEETQSLHL